MKNAVINIVLVCITITAAIVLGSQAPSLYQQWRGSTTSGDFSMHLAGQPSKLTLYGTTTCPYCKQARAYLQARNIPYNDVLVDEFEEAQQRYSQLGTQAVPVLVSEKQFVVGFNEKEYSRFLELNQARQ